MTFWVFELFFEKLLFDFLREKWLFDFLSFFFEKLLFDFLREKLLFDFLTFCAKSAYSRSKAFLRRERRLDILFGIWLRYEVSKPKKNNKPPPYL